MNALPCGGVFFFVNESINSGPKKVKNFFVKFFRISFI